VRPLRNELFNADGRTDRQTDRHADRLEEVNNSMSQLSQSAKNDIHTLKKTCSKQNLPVISRLVGEEQVLNCPH
jgi:hypothetical protein